MQQALMILIYKNLVEMSYMLGSFRVEFQAKLLTTEYLIL